MKNIAKIIILTSSLILVGCNNNTNASTNTNNYSGDCFLVDLIKDEYKVEEFKEAFDRYAKEHIHYDSDMVALGIANVMPHQIVDDYGVGLYTVKTTDGGQSYDDAYLYYNKEVYKVSPSVPRMGAKDSKYDGLITGVAFTDLNKDSKYEVTVSYLHKHNSVSIISTLDLASQGYVKSSETYRSEYSLKKENNAIAIYNKEQFLANIKPYIKDYELNEEMVTLEDTNFRAKVTWSKFETLVPVDYPNLQHRFKVDVNLMYLGETFTYTGSMAPDIPEVFFYKGDVEVSRYETLVDAAIKDHTVFKNDELTATHYFYDEYDHYNAKGTYDIKVSFRDMEITKENILTIK
jgi:hypothetical protein